MAWQTKAGSKALPGQNHNPGLETVMFFLSIERFQLKKENVYL